MIRFFGDLPSERAIATRCADPISPGSFLGYGPNEHTPDHSSLSVIRQQSWQKNLPNCLRIGPHRALRIRPDQQAEPQHRHKRGGKFRKTLGAANSLGGTSS